MPGNCGAEPRQNVNQRDASAWVCRGTPFHLIIPGTTKHILVLSFYIKPKTISSWSDPGAGALWTIRPGPEMETNEIYIVLSLGATLSLKGFAACRRGKLPLCPALPNSTQGWQTFMLMFDHVAECTRHWGKQTQH